MQQRHTDRRRYFDESANTSRKFYLNYLADFTEINAETRVLEVGCGEGGNLLPFAELGCHVTGIDYAEFRIEQAKEFFSASGYEGTFISADFFEMPKPEEKYDIILIHDVIEHVQQKDIFVEKLRQFFKETSIVFWGFPAWQMPFGGHQQICKSKICASLPFIHLLPTSMYKGVLKMFGESEGNIKELIEIKQCRITIEFFELLMERCGYAVLNRKLWWINPHYEQKFGLKPIKLNRYLARIPYIRNFISSSCFYITKEHF